MQNNQVILEVSNLKKYFPLHKGVFKRVIGHVKAVDDISFSIKAGETLGLVGESGCGKSTAGRTIIGLHKPTAGSIRFRYEGDMCDISKARKDELKKVRRDMQIVFQDPYSSLDPRMSVLDIVREPLKAHKIGNDTSQKERVAELLSRVGLNESHMNRYPHEFSGGQRQRIGIARALALSPEFIICDEPVSALDVSIQAQILNLMKDLQREMNLTYLFIAHDLSVVEYVSDRIMVMYLGKVMEVGKTSEMYIAPKHPYTEALLSAIPSGDPLVKKKRLPLEGSVPDAVNPPPGCTFHTRCPYAKEICSSEIPELAPVSEEHFVACHFSGQIALSGYRQLRQVGQTL